MSKLLHANIFGEGKPFVILHGFLGMGDNWKTIAKDFSSNGYQLFLVDQRNHGKSFHSDIFNYETLADDLFRFCEHHNLNEIVLLGHSMGGKTAMSFAVKYPELVSKLIIADIGPKYYPPHHQQILKGMEALSLNEQALKSRGAADEFLSQYISEWGIRQFLLKNLYWLPNKTLALRVNLPVLIEQIEEIGKPLLEGQIYHGDTLFLKGETSDYIKAEDEKDIKKHFPTSTIVTIPDAGHWLHAENPEKFYQELIKFL